MTDKMAVHVRCVASVLDLSEAVLADCELFIERCTVSLVKAEVGPDF